MTQAEYESLAFSYPASWDDDATGNLWEGVALWRLVALVDDGDNTTFSDAMASAGYNVRVIAADDYSYTFPSQEVAAMTTSFWPTNWMEPPCRPRSTL